MKKIIEHTTKKEYAMKRGIQMLTIKLPTIQIYGPTDIEDFKKAVPIGATVQGSFNVSEWYTALRHSVAYLARDIGTGSLLRVDISDSSPYVIAKEDGTEVQFPYVIIVIESEDHKGLWK
jgi:hypothetical protein